MIFFKVQTIPTWQIQRDNKIESSNGQKKKNINKSKETKNNNKNPPFGWIEWLYKEHRNGKAKTFSYWILLASQILLSFQNHHNNYTLGWIQKSISLFTPEWLLKNNHDSFDISWIVTLLIPLRVHLKLYYQFNFICLCFYFCFVSVYS